MSDLVGDIFEHFQEYDTDSIRAAYAILIVRSSYRNPRTPDGLVTIIVRRYDGKCEWNSILTVDDMLIWLRDRLKYGFNEEDDSFIEERLWDEILKHSEKELDKSRG